MNDFSPIKRSFSSPSILTTQPVKPTTTVQPTETTTENSTTSTVQQPPQSTQSSGPKTNLLDVQPELEKSLSSTVPIQNHDNLTAPKQLQDAINELQELAPKPELSLGKLIDKTGFGDIENSLRTTAFKWNSTVKGLLDKATNEAEARMKSDPNFETLSLKLMANPTIDIKNEIARSIGALRSDKYGNHSNYHDLSANKKALVDAIYKGMMRSTIDVNGSLSKDKTPKGAIQEPGVRANLTRDITIDGVQFKKGDKCVFVEKEGELFIQQIVKKENGKSGSLDEFQVKPTLFKLPSKDIVKLGNQSFKISTAPLFEGPVSVKDIRQGAIGDCYLIAGIYSLAQKNPQAIHDMMRDNGDGTVTVRFYEKDKDTQQYKEVPITISKSTLTTSEHAEDTLWVQMLEKAYASYKGSYEAIGKGGHTNDVFSHFLGVDSESVTLPIGGSKVSNIIDSMPAYALTPSAILEMKANKNKIGLSEEEIDALRSANVDSLKDFNSMTNIKEIEDKTGLDLSRFYQAEVRVKSLPKETDPQIKLQAMQEFQQEKALRTEMQNTMNRYMSTEKRKGAIDNLLKMSSTFQKIQSNPIVYREDMEQIITELKEIAKKQPTIQNKGETYQVQHLISDLEEGAKDRVFPNKDKETLQGVVVDYTKEQTDMFNTIKEALNSGKMLALGSKEEIGVSQGRGHSGGESMVDGLAGQHAYALLDIVEMNGRKFVKIANPWGNDFSRDYVQKDGQLQTRRFDQSNYDYLPESEPNRKGAGIGVNESWIELRDLCTTFNSLYITH